MRTYHPGGGASDVRPPHTQFPAVYGIGRSIADLVFVPVPPAVSRHVDTADESLSDFPVDLPSEKTGIVVAHRVRQNKGGGVPSGANPHDKPKPKTPAVALSKDDLWRLESLLNCPAYGHLQVAEGIRIPRMFIGSLGRWMIVVLRKDCNYDVYQGCATHNSTGGILEYRHHTTFDCNVSHLMGPQPPKWLIAEWDQPDKTRIFTLNVSAHRGLKFAFSGLSGNSVRDQQLNGAAGSWTGTDDVEPSPPRSASMSPANEDAGRQNKPKKSKQKAVECHLCGGDHFARGCPRAAQDRRRAASGKPRRDRTGKKKATIEKDRADKAEEGAGAADADLDAANAKVERLEDEMWLFEAARDKLVAELAAYTEKRVQINNILEQSSPAALAIHLALRPIEGVRTKEQLVALVKLADESDNKNLVDMILRELQHVPVTKSHADEEALGIHLPRHYVERVADVYLFVPLRHRFTELTTKIAGGACALTIAFAGASLLNTLLPRKYHLVSLAIEIVLLVVVFVFFVIILLFLFWPRRLKARVRHTFDYRRPSDSEHEVLSRDRRNLAHVGLKALARMDPYYVSHSLTLEVLHENIAFWRRFAIFRVLYGACVGFPQNLETWVQIRDTNAHYSLNNVDLLEDNEAGTIDYRFLHAANSNLTPFLDGLLADETLLRFLATTARNMLPAEFDFALVRKHVAQLLCTNGVVASNLFSSSTNGMFHACEVFAVLAHLQILADTRQRELECQPWAF